MTSPTAAEAWHARADELADWIMRRLVNRRDRYGGQCLGKDGKVGRKTFPIDAPDGRTGCVTVQLLRQHARARGTTDVIGLHALGPDSSGKW